MDTNAINDAKKLTQTESKISSEKLPEITKDFIFDEPDDILEEFDEIGGNDNYVDPEVAEWDEHWDTTGWDDEDPNDEFILKLQQELESFRTKTSLQPAAAKKGGD